jgi:deazaflavin-dependent oxidoreductase (nitroreductase family)
MLHLWRLGLGPWVNLWPKVGGRIMVITHTGRKTGGQHRTPANYAIVNGEIYCTAAFGARSDWYRNILTHPQIEVWLPNGWWFGVAEEVKDPVHRVPLMRQVLIGSGLAARIAGINPYRYSDKELERATAQYRLIRIRLLEPRTGPGGPGDLAWIWPLATMILLPTVLFRKKDKSK